MALALILSSGTVFSQSESLLNLEKKCKDLSEKKKFLRERLQRTESLINYNQKQITRVNPAHIRLKTKLQSHKILLERKHDKIKTTLIKHEEILAKQRCPTTGEF